MWCDADSYPAIQVEIWAEKAAQKVRKGDRDQQARVYACALQTGQQKYFYGFVSKNKNATFVQITILQTTLSEERTKNKLIEENFKNSQEKVTVGINFLVVQPDLWPLNFFMKISQGSLDISQNTI